jgi:hypothetical protein
LPVVLFHPIAGRWGPACLRAATASVETVSPPLQHLFYHFCRYAAFTRPTANAIEPARNQLTRRTVALALATQERLS